MPTLPLEQRTLEAAQLAKRKVLYTKFRSLIKNHQNSKNLIEDKKTASGKRVQRIISMSAQIVCSVDREMRVLLVPA
jgi:hypothetical protein